MNFTKILKSPVVTEKATADMQKGNKYTFVVSRESTKGQVSEAIESLYKVNVINVNTLKNRGRLKRSMVGRKARYRSSDTKKAIVQLKSGDSLKIYEGSQK